MKLKSIQISGFKSFADKTTINFKNGLTGIVGPNGSGKSNVIEAVRWALGEQSAKTLRGKKMKDVIFSGSKYRHPLNRAEVSLIFDNTTHFLDSDYTEVKVTRKYYRNGDSIYSINDKECLLRDINNLFMDTGLGEGSLSIISQGNVDDILDDDIEKRRSIIETAAGVYRYKKQKNESKKKLDDTQDNLDRISDIIVELKKQMNPLKEQSENASLYLSKQKYFNQLNFNKYKIEIANDDEEQSNLTTKYKKDAEDLANLNKELENLKKEKNVVNEKNNELDRQSDSLQAQLLAETKLLETSNSEKKLHEQQQKFNKQKKAEIEQHISELQTQKKNLEYQIEKLHSQEQEIAESISDAKTKIKASNIEEVSSDLDNKENELEETRAQYVSLMQKLTDRKNDLRLKEKLAQQSDNVSAEKRAQIKGNKQDLSELNKNLTNDKEELQDLSNKKDKLIASYNKMKETVSKLGPEIDNKQKAWYKQLRDFQGMKTERDTLKSMIDNHGNLYRGTRNLLRQKDKLSGILGTVSDFIDVPKKLSTAIEITLGGSIQQVIVENVADARNAIKFLKENKQGRVTLLPIKEINERFISDNLLAKINKQPGFVGIASDLVNMPTNMQRVKKHLLGNVVVAEDLKSATKLSALTNHRVKIVSIAGDVINSGGSITGGRNKRQSDGLLSQKNKLIQFNEKVNKMSEDLNKGEKTVKKMQNEQQDLQDKINDVYKQGTDLNSKIEVKQKNIKFNQDTIDKKTRAIKAIELTLSNNNEIDSDSPETIENAIEQIQVKIDDNQERNKAVKNEIDVLKGKLQVAKDKVGNINQTLAVSIEQDKNLQGKITELKNELANVNSEIKNSQISIDKLVKELKENSKLLNVDVGESQETINKIKSNIKQVKEELENHKKKFNELDNQISINQNMVLSSNETVQHEQSQINVVAENIAKNKQRINNLLADYGEFEKIDLNLDEINKEISNVQAEINDLGSVNVGAIDAYKELKERYKFMQGQMDDLLSSKEQLLAIMNKMDETVKKRFDKTYQAVSKAFSKVFRNIFGGGEAKLKLEDPHHLLTTGIDILVKPPGKRYRNINLLSGGEKALTALALLFAVLEVKPVPFVILDEAESALDPANVDRFARYIQALKKETQFIVITHRKETMVYADNLYGITMQDSGISKLVSVNLNDFKN